MKGQWRGSSKCLTEPFLTAAWVAKSSSSAGNFFESEEIAYTSIGHWANDSLVQSWDGCFNLVFFSTFCRFLVVLWLFLGSVLRRHNAYSICDMSLRRTPPPLLPQASVPLPPKPKGGKQNCLQVRGWGSPNSDDWRKALCLLCVLRIPSGCPSKNRTRHLSYADHLATPAPKFCSDTHPNFQFSKSCPRQHSIPLLFPLLTGPDDRLWGGAGASFLSPSHLDQSLSIGFDLHNLALAPNLSSPI